MTITRRRLCSAAGAAVLAGLAGCITDSSAPEADDSGTTGADGDEWDWSGTLPVDGVVQHYDPSCGCCSAYADYLEGHGIDVEREPTDDRDAVRRDLGVPDDAASCHTVEVGDYLVEGHVPLEAIETLLAEGPDVGGVSIPGMPRNAPGMGPPAAEPLRIYAFDESGKGDEFVAL